MMLGAVINDPFTNLNSLAPDASFNWGTGSFSYTATDSNTSLLDSGVTSNPLYSNYVITDAYGNPVMVNGSAIDASKAENASYISSITNQPYTSTPITSIQKQPSGNSSSVNAKDVWVLAGVLTIILLVGSR